MSDRSLTTRFRTFLRGYPPTTALADSWAEHRRYVAFATGLFAAGIVLGAILASMGYNLLELIAEITGEEVFPDPEETEINARFYIQNNSIPFMLSIFGAISLGVLTAWIMLFNGVIVGNVVAPIAPVAGIDFVLVALLPHGIFELPALFLAAAVGFRIVYRFGERIFGRRDAFVTYPYLYRTALFVILAWLMLAVAAVIEAHITPALIELLFSERLEGLETAPQP